MVYVDNNEKLAGLIENLLSKDVRPETISDAKDLIIELRSQSNEINLVNSDTLYRRIRKHISQNEQSIY